MSSQSKSKRMSIESEVDHNQLIVDQETDKRSKSELLISNQEDAKLRLCTFDCYFSSRKMSRNVNNRQVESSEKEARVQLNEIKCRKSYHPIIRLRTAITLIVQAIIILTTVPSKHNCLQSITTNSSNNNSTANHLMQYSTGRQANLSQLNQNQALVQQQQMQQNLDWAKRLIKQPINTDLQFQNKLSTNIGLQYPINNVKNSEQQQQLINRQTLLAEFVSNQSQRILKNLANTTIADLVAQSASRIANSKRNLQMLQQQHQVSGLNNQIMQTNHLNARYFPTMNKLYTLLFPNNQQTPTVNQVKPLEPTTNVTNANFKPTTPISTPTEIIDSSSSNHRDVYSIEKPNISYRHRDSRAASKERQMMSLSAPYDSRPRKPAVSISSDTSVNSKSRRSRRDRSSSPNHSYLYDQFHEPMSEDMNETGALPAGMDPETMSTFESSDLGSTKDDNLGNVDGSKGEDMYSTGEQQNGQDMQQAAEQPSLQFATESDFGYYGDRKRPSAENNHQVALNEANEQHLIQGQEPAMEGSNEQVMEAELNQAEQHQVIDEEPQQMVEVDHRQPSNSSFTSDTRSEMHDNRSMDPSAGFSNEDLINQKTLSSNDTDTQNDETFLTAKLPSQYDASVMRLPPEGYYDDYFKPTSNTVAHSPSASSISHENGISEFNPTGEMQANQGDQFEVDGDVNNSSLSSVQYNHNFGDTSPATYVPISMDYTKQFYMNQQPLKQNEVMADQTVEFLKPNKDNNMSSSDQQHDNKKEQIDGLQYELPVPNYEQNSNPQPSNRSTSASSNRYSNNNNNKQVGASNSSFGVNEDSLQVIIANTNGSGLADSEKIINYTSEGNNMTRFAGNKSPRNTFVNKDMNEFPPGDEHQQQEQQQQQRQQQGQEQEQQQTDDEQPASVMSLGGQLRSMRATTMSPNQRLAADPNQSSIRQPIAAPIRRLRPIQEDDSIKEEELRRTTLGPTHFGRYNSIRIDEPYFAQLPALPIGRANFARASNQVASERRQKDRQHNRQQQHDGKTGGIAREKINRLPAMRQPQITQVNLKAKDLILSQPTAQPSVADTAMDTISELPAKMKRIREQPPDKNELMNELLTALDRVKVAIYKLQPLTAKMNAIYRKSVTSNTRDIIMDNHKGTYAKRYPPGDYDDTYDRMHPSELLNRQRASTNSDRSTTNGRPVDRSLDGSESTPDAVYLPAPRELLERYERDMTNSTRKGDSFEMQGLEAGESQFVATGIGRRLGDGRVRGQLSLSSAYDEWDESNADVNRTLPSDLQRSNKSDSGEATAFQASTDSAAPNFVPQNQLLDESQSPLFGYRITIFHSPEPNADDEDTRDNNEQFSYRVDGMGSLAGDDSVRFSSTDDDSMATSESSISADSTLPDLVSDSSGYEQDVEPDESESKGSKKKSKKWEKDKKSSKEAESEKHNAKEGSKKRKEASKKSQSKKKKHEEESKKKKEYKKIKHNKGILSKEKKTMHRDKHIKAHDRGAAKEKALKERTQIEFFEREQIVDDEFEKGKKSTIKAGWQTGHDSKKTLKDSHSGEPMSLAGSHHVSHESKDKQMEKSAGVALKASSGKKSNKFEKKDMEAKGKKFKGWREKGYKIITETEFIDRGSLHDSAYKKRDKGAAHHQKYKKQEASSEGHHGSMHESHKKSQKKEEKKSKMHEKKEKHSKKSEKDKEDAKEEKKEAGEKKKKAFEAKEHEHDKEMMANTLDSKSEPANKDSSDDQDDNLEGKESMQNLRKHQRALQPTLMSASSSTFRPVSMQAPTSQQQYPQVGVLARLLSANHHEEPTRYNSNRNVEDQVQNSTHLEDYRPPVRYVEHLIEADRRSDNTDPQQTVSHQQVSNGSIVDRNNATILDIVDNLTGRQLNKTRIGTYELDQHHTNRLFDNSSLNSINNRLAKYQPQQVSSTTTVMPFSMRPMNKENADAALLLNLMQKAKQSADANDMMRNKPTQMPLRLEQRQSPVNMRAPPGFMIADQADAAAQFLQLVHRANQAQSQAANLIDQSNPLASAIHQAAFIQPTIPAAYQQRPPSIFAAQQLNHFTSGMGGGSSLRPGQFLDYDQDPLTQNNYLAN